MADKKNITHLTTPPEEDDTLYVVRDRDWQKIWGVNLSRVEASRLKERIVGMRRSRTARLEPMPDAGAGIEWLAMCYDAELSGEVKLGHLEPDQVQAVRHHRGEVTEPAASAPTVPIRRPIADLEARRAALRKAADAKRAQRPAAAAPAPVAPTPVAPPIEVPEPEAGEDPEDWDDEALALDGAAIEDIVGD